MEVGRQSLFSRLKRWFDRKKESRAAGQRRGLPPLELSNCRPTFAVGCGRSGTHFLTSIMAETQGVCAQHLDTIGHLVGDGLLHYAEWYALPIDRGGFIDHRMRLVQEAADRGEQYFEANSYLSLSVNTLFERLNARFIHLSRCPERVVHSHFAKGWYQNRLERVDEGLIVGYSYDYPPARPHRYFGHVMPRDRKEFRRWAALTRVGKIAWYWNEFNRAIHHQLSLLPKTHYLQARVEEIDYDGYLELLSLLGGQTTLSRARFETIRKEKPGQRQHPRASSNWSSEEMAEFLSETQEMRVLLGFGELKL